MIKKLLVLLFLPCIMLGQNTLSGTFNPEDGYQFGILYRITPDNVFYITDTNIAPDGSFSLQIPQDTSKGMYRLVYNLPQAQYFFDFLYDGENDIHFKFSQDTLQTYDEGSLNDVWISYRRQLNIYEQDLAGLMAGGTLQPADLQKILLEKQDWYNQVIEKAKGTLALLYIQATKPYMGTDFMSVEEFNEKSRAQILDAIPFSNPLIQNSALPLEQSLKYIYNYVDEDALEKSRENNIDGIAKALKEAQPSFQKSLLNNIYNFLVSQEQAIEANYLAEKHLIPVAKSANDTALVTSLKLYKSLSIGEKAPNFSWPEYEGDKETTNSLHNLEGYTNYVIVFWSSLCSHCLKEVPVLHKKITELADGDTKVIAVGLEDFEQEWAPKAAEFPKFINVLGLGKWENEIGNLYDVTATPTYYFLDKDKNIKAKPETLEALIQLIDVNTN